MAANMKVDWLLQLVLTLTLVIVKIQAGK